MQRISTTMRFLFFFLFSFVTPAESGNDIAVETTAMDLNYRIDAFECGDELRKLSKEDQQKKKLSTVYRICFEPNHVARGSGVGIKKVDFWNWETSHADGTAVQAAVLDGNGVGGISEVECLDGGKLCYLDTFLTTAFYHNAGTVLGNGEVSFTAGTGSVPVKFNLFSFDFKVKLRSGPDGEEYTDDETAELLQKVNAHNAVVETEKSNENTMAGDFKSTDEVKEEL
jgi:hypothetical protein